jgi:CO/xanthine dehydrogenase FAD-binding subunit
MTYHRPGQLRDALAALAGQDMLVLAGGTDVFPARQGRDLDHAVLDLTAISDLSGIRETAAGWDIGATTPWAMIAEADLPAAFHALQQAAKQVGSVQIQNSGTIGGNLCNASPAADGVPPLLVLGAEVILTSTKGDRRLPLTNFLIGVRSTARACDEIVTAIHLPKAHARGRAVFGKVGARKYLVISTAMAAVRVILAEGVIEDAAIAVGACSPVAQRLPGMEAALRGTDGCDPGLWQAQLRADIARHLTPIDDIRADAAYRQGAVAVLVSDLILQAVAV